VVVVVVCVCVCACVRVCVWGVLVTVRFQDLAGHDVDLVLLEGLALECQFDVLFVQSFMLQEGLGQVPELVLVGRQEIGGPLLGTLDT